MSMSRDRDFRGFALFILVFALLFAVAALSLLAFQVRQVKELYLAHDEAVVSALLEAGISKSTVAAALTGTETTPDGQRLTAAVGIGARSDNALHPFISRFQSRTVAAVLSVLVLCAGSLMIASSLNSNVAQRTEFFGLLRCVGATPRQVMRLVRREALNWCRFAIPVGVLCGVAVIWVLCAVLRALSPEYFGAMPALAFSAASVLAGLVIGLLTVLLAARAPAKRAARTICSPCAARRIRGFSRSTRRLAYTTRAKAAKTLP